MKKIIVKSPSRWRRSCPVSVEITGITKAVLKEESTAKLIPCQIENSDGKTFLHWIEEDLRPGAEKTYILEDGGQTEFADRAKVELKENSASLEVNIGGALFTRYNYEPESSKPYFYPVVGPYGANLTRHYPMLKDVEGETKDHHHHKSIYVAFGDLNGANIWDEETNHGYQKHKKFLKTESGYIYGGFISENDWTDKDGKVVIQEERRAKIFNTPGSARIMDIEVIFKATQGKVKFGDTKEGGIIAVRVPTSMDGDKGGKIENAYGGKTENETWGRKAEWVDYSGPVKTKWGMVWMGTSIFDNPKNLRYPTNWHVRDYGLFAANCFAYKSYYGEQYDGSYELPAGGELSFKYRLYFHIGDTKDAIVGDKFHDYVNPPEITLL